MTGRAADVCLILEGTYPYVTGGVSQWVHDLLGAQSDLTFHLVTLLAPGSDQTERYRLPDNVSGVTRLYLPDLRPGRREKKDDAALFAALEEPLIRLQSGGGLETLAAIRRALEPGREQLGSEVLLNSRGAWKLLVRMYEQTHASSSFIQYFWGWRALLGGLYTALLCDLPAARVYHTVCTGYAGLLAARARLETGRPAVLTEHGIYLNERRIEIALAEWLHEPQHQHLSVEQTLESVKDLWVGMFSGYARACYQACERVITLFEGNQPLQLADGADPRRMAVIPNGIRCEDPMPVRPEGRSRPPAVALIGRVVPIKDVKTFLRACHILRARIPNLKAWVLGPTDEDLEYYEQCLQMVSYLNLEETVSFEGRVNLQEYFGRLDVLVLTSISEAQPLVILEAGAYGIPTVATNVGSCAEMILGRSDEEPRLGPAGIVTPLANPAATAEAVARLLTDGAFYRRCSRAIRERLRRHYNKTDLDRSYRLLYEELRQAPDRLALDPAA